MLTGGASRMGHKKYTPASTRGQRSSYDFLSTPTVCFANTRPYPAWRVHIGALTRDVGGD
jgi:hypothetical protein